MVHAASAGEQSNTSWKVGWATETSRDVEDRHDRAEHHDSGDEAAQRRGPSLSRRSSGLRGGGLGRPGQTVGRSTDTIHAVGFLNRADGVAAHDRAGGPAGREMARRAGRECDRSRVAAYCTDIVYVEPPGRAGRVIWCSRTAGPTSRGRRCAATARAGGGPGPPGRASPTTTATAGPAASGCSPGISGRSPRTRDPAPARGGEAGTFLLVTAGARSPSRLSRSTTR